MSLWRCFFGGAGVSLVATGLGIEQFSRPWLFFLIGAALVMTALYEKAKP